MDTMQIIAFTNTNSWKKINTWFEQAPDNCWRPNDNAGLELIIISFDEKSIKILNNKIKEKFKVLSDPKIAI